jgi:hypothetical protein
MNKIMYPILVALALTGCVRAAMPSKLSESHPANPAAAQPSYSPLAPFLMADTNLVAMTNASTNAPEHEHPQNAKPESTIPHKHDTK